MKRFSAPPALYPPPSQPPSSSSEAPAGIDATATSGNGNGNGLGPPPSLQQHHPHDPSGKRVKTEQTFESLFDVENHSDVIVRVNGDQFVFHAHRVILEMKSDVMARLLAGLVEKQHEEDEEEGGVTSVGSRFVPVLRVTEDPECSQVFSRFLYFLYSGAVWLHQDYVLPLFRLAHKYNVRPLLAHCETYILQVLAKSCSGPHHSDPRPMHPHGHHQHNNFSYSYSHHHPHHHSLHHSHSPSSAPTTANLNCPPYTGSGFPLEVICDLYEDDVFAGDVGQTCFRVLCCQFRQLVRLPRWTRCRVQTVCELISSDQCSVEENLILVSATDYMKQNNLSDKKQIESILANIRYPCLNRRLLYHLHKNGSFKNFPYIQELMLNAMKYHCFKDLAEAKEDFVGVQFTPRIGGGQPLRRASMQMAVAAPTTDCYPEHMAFPESAFSLESELPVVLTRSRHSQV